MRNELKRRDRGDYVLSESNEGVITSVDGIVRSALLVSGNCPVKALAFLHRNGADPKDEIMGQVIQKLEARHT